MELDRQRKGMEQKLYDLTVKIVNECGYKLYDVDYIPGSSTLRVFIMDEKTNTAIIEDCVAVDRAFSPYCEEENWIPDELVLEVSSPGVFRDIKNKEHFEQNIGQIVSLTILGKLDEKFTSSLPAKIKGANKFRGTLKNVLDESFVLDIDGSELELNYQQVKKINLDPDINR